MEVEQESLDLIEPTQDHVETENTIEMSEEIQFDSEKTDTEPQNDEGNFLIDQWNSFLVQLRTYMYHVYSKLVKFCEGFNI